MKILPAAIIGLLIALPSYAGVKEKKAIRAMTADIEIGLAKMKTHCGNKALVLHMDVDKQFSADNIRIARSNAKDFFDGMVSVCKDADYQAEISKIEEFKVTLSNNPTRTGQHEKIYGEITLKDTLMQVAFHIKYSMSNGEGNKIPRAIQGLY